MPSMGAWCRVKRMSIGGPGNDIEARDPRDEGSDTVDSGNGSDECWGETVSNCEPQSTFAKGSCESFERRTTSRSSGD